MNTRQHYQAETVAREALGLAAAGYANKQATIFVGNYSIRINQLKHGIRASSDDFRIDLQLEPQKPLVLHGKQGYSRKGDTSANASCYYSFPRLLTSGVITVGDATEAVAGLSWMDHEFSTAPLQADLVGWDWFSLQLDNNTELMLYLLRYADGHYHSASSGSFIDQKGQVTPLAAKEIRIKRLKTWHSSVSNGTYPISWQVKIPAIRLRLNIEAQLADQEMHTAKTTGVVYWEGSVRADGKLNGHAVKGEGYVELTGYAQPFKAPL
jgi:predicted secreted hydrolase